MTECELALIRYGIGLLAQQLGQAAPDAEQLGAMGAAIHRVETPGYAAVERARELMGDTWAAGSLRSESGENLVSIFSLVDRGGGAPVQSTPLRPFSFDGPGSAAVTTFSPTDLFRNFIADVARIVAGSGAFETFCSVMALYGWAVPSSLCSNYSLHFDPTGVSVFEQFKFVTATAHCLDRQPGREDLLLIGGDIPGIQTMLYTITSRGVAKSLRGRSLYLQLLGDAVVRLLLGRFRLPAANVVVNAGGNFKVLIPAAIEPDLEGFREAVNRIMLDLHGGELYVSLAWAPLNAAALIDARPRDGGGEVAIANATLADALRREKDRWFANLARQDPRHYRAVFGPFGQGGPLTRDGDAATICKVCHVDVTSTTRDEDDDSETYCRQCLSFERLANQVWRARWLEVAPSPQRPARPQLGWNDALEAFGFRYEFHSAMLPRRDSAPRWIYRLNDISGFLGDSGEVAYGVRGLTNLTPHIVEKGKEVIRDISTMAEKDATGVRRYGVLRMDVDDLGAVFGGALRYQDLFHISTLSAAVKLFFEGHLGSICVAAAREWRGAVGSWHLRAGRDGDDQWKAPYVIYAGGDDLFIVGCWDVLPELARAIRSAFHAYSEGRLTMSAGINLGHDKFPLYQAADSAGAALRRAKHLRAGDAGSPKDAVTFLGASLTWKEFEPVRRFVLTLAQLLGSSGEGTGAAPRALLRVLGAAAADYKSDDDAARSATLGSEQQVRLGPWLWRLNYGLGRMAARLAPPMRDGVLALNGSPRDARDSPPGAAWRIIRHLDLAVRWAEFLVRKEEVRNGGAR